MPLASHRGVLSRTRKAADFVAVGAQVPTPTNNTGVTITKPAGVGSGDGLIAVIQTDDAAVVVSGPAGWVQLESSGSLEVWAKTAGGAEPADYAFTWPSVGHNVAASAAIVAYRGDPADPVDDSTVEATHVDATVAVVAPSVVTAFPNERVVSIFAYKRASGSGGMVWTPPAGTTVRVDLDYFAVVSFFLLVVDHVAAAPGATGTRTAVRSTSSSGEEVGVTVALNPV